jgi:GDP-L-fucose synthase
MANMHPLAPTWPDSATFWRDKRVIVTGGSGFLGSFVVDKLHARGAAEVIVPRRADYDLRDIDAIRQLFADANNCQVRQLSRLSPLFVIHLAAHVGGIGANRAKPAEFFYDNLMMGGAAYARGVARRRGQVHRHRHGAIRQRSRNV